jgi:hypothetical protein
MGDWLMILFAVAAGVLTFLKIIDRNKPVPPLHNQFADKVETEKRFTCIEREIDVLRRDTIAGLRENNAAAEARADKIHNRINEVLGAVSELKGVVSKLPCDKHC